MSITLTVDTSPPQKFDLGPARGTIQFLVNVRDLCCIDWEKEGAVLERAVSPEQRIEREEVPLLVEVINEVERNLRMVPIDDATKWDIEFRGDDPDRTEVMLLKMSEEAISVRRLKELGFTITQSHYDVSELRELRKALLGTDGMKESRLLSVADLFEVVLTGLKSACRVASESNSGLKCW